MNTSSLLNQYQEDINLAMDSFQPVYGERALYRLLVAHEKEITGLIEEDETGLYFHKSFRQIDVTNSGHIDMAIWLLLQQAPIFWNILSLKE